MAGLGGIIRDYLGSMKVALPGSKKASCALKDELLGLLEGLKISILYELTSVILQSGMRVAPHSFLKLWRIS